MCSNYETNGNVAYSCKDHGVRCPKYRRKVLVNSVDMRLKEIIQQTAQEFRVQ
jgi:putative transposase